MEHNGLRNLKRYVCSYVTTKVEMLFLTVHVYIFIIYAHVELQFVKSFLHVM